LYFRLGAVCALAVRILLLLGGAIGLGTFAVTIAQRVGFPFPLEWMEGASLQHALWIAHGKLPYAAPSAQLIAYLYPPLAYLPWAVAVKLVGISLPAARACSLASCVGAFLLVARAGTRVGGSAVAGWFAAGTFAAGFGYTGAFLDLVRVDALFVLLIAAAAERLSADRPRAALGWLALSALAKQPGLILLAAVSLGLIVRAPRAQWRAVLATWLALGAALLGLQLATSGWFARYVFELPGGHPLEPKRLLSFVLVDLLLYVPVLTLGAAFALHARRKSPSMLDWLLLAACAASALGRAHPGGDDNVRLPAFALLCICGAAPLAGRALSSATRTGVRAWLLALVLLQLTVLWQPPSAHAPSARSESDFAALRAAVATCGNGGRGVALDHALLTATPFMHTMALSDLRMARSTGLGELGTRALLAALRAADAPVAIAVGEHFPALDRVLAERYRECALLPAPQLATGYQPGRAVGDARTQVVYALRGASPQPRQ
jgi:hypothetical protein